MKDISKLTHIKKFHQDINVIQELSTLGNIKSSKNLVRFINIYRAKTNISAIWDAQLPAYNCEQNFCFYSHTQKTRTTTIFLTYLTKCSTKHLCYDGFSHKQHKTISTLLTDYSILITNSRWEIILVSMALFTLLFSHNEFISIYWQAD